ncbi:histidine phosphatase family protein [Flavobacterium ammoniigenes]|jgi:2,3-bisphosphoglycerate-dependent phosphoglycerate mutase|uniref:histidine phosphatase family protein n=1 Tax=Flavobacterium ammoniigenes TaxID=1751095 RepID=UPI001E5CD6E2|nr:histidine phosphatase family protein [Flavobacterium ammoniigenes]
MKKIIVFLLFFFFQISLGQNTFTQYYFIRHAEKADSSKNPDLSEKGLERAQEWKTLFSEINFDAVYSTDFNRTLQTIQPIVEGNNQLLKIYNPKMIDIEAFKKETHGKTILIVGHSNTIPNMINQIIKENKYTNIEENEFGNLYIVTLFENQIVSQLLHLK